MNLKVVLNSATGITDVSSCRISINDLAVKEAGRAESMDCLDD